MLIKLVVDKVINRNRL